METARLNYRTKNAVTPKANKIRQISLLGSSSIETQRDNLKRSSPQGDDASKSNVKTNRRFSFEQNQCNDKSVVDYKPVGTWMEKKISGGAGFKNFHISTSFISVGLSINCHSTTSVVMISGSGISKIKILLRGEDAKRGPSHMSISEMVIPEASIYDKGIQRIMLDLPLPCKTVEVLIVERTADFVCILGVSCFSSSIRSSSLSTPVHAVQDSHAKDSEIL